MGSPTALEVGELHDVEGGYVVAYEWMLTGPRGVIAKYVIEAENPPPQAQTVRRAIGSSPVSGDIPAPGFDKLRTENRRFREQLAATN